jgi:hypothetical protein
MWASYYANQAEIEAYLAAEAAEYDRLVAEQTADQSIPPDRLRHCNGFAPADFWFSCCRIAANSR